MEEVKRKRGRPRKESSMDKRYKMDADEELFNAIEELSKELGMSKSDLIRRVIRMYGNLYEAGQLPDK